MIMLYAYFPRLNKLHLKIKLIYLMPNKLNVIKDLLRSNGVLWFSLYTLERFFGWITHYFYIQRINLEIAKHLPGFNTKYYNYKEWSNYNWSNEGEEWTDSKTWKSALLENTIHKYFLPQKSILEIGPGAGRWSGVLAELAQSLTLVDITEVSINRCKEKLKNYSSCKYYVSKGNDLSFLENNSIDYIWSFDVFVHIAPTDTESYMKELSRVLRQNGIGIIHHPAAGGHKGGFRSSTTNHFFRSILTKYQFTVLNQFDSWGENNSFSVKTFDDMITVFKKPKRPFR